MERKEPTSAFLDLLTQPAFSVRGGVIERVNGAAKAYFLEPGMPIGDLLLTGKAEYPDMAEGCLYLTLSLSGEPFGASVRRMEGFDIFTLEQDRDQTELQAMALAAMELREPLSNVMTVADQLFPMAQENEDPDVKTQVSRINRGLFQMLRIVGNMSDAYRYSKVSEPKMSVVNVTSVMEEVFQCSAQLLENAGTHLHFENLKQPVCTLADQEKLERAVHNIISNAVKFAGKGGRVDARLTRRENMLYLTVQDHGDGIGDDVRSNVHTRFRRQPGLEDRRFGIGLGMVLIRNAAAIHGGTVLMDHPEGCGTRIIMSMAIMKKADSMVRSSVMQVDYAGERDHSLIELSDVLPNSLYESTKIN